MLKLFLDHKALFMITLLFSIMGSALTIYAAYILANIMNAVVEGDWKLFTTMLWVVLGFMVTLLIVAICGGLAEKKLVVSVIQDLRLGIHEGIISRDTEHYRMNNSTDYLSSLTNDIKIVEENAIVPFLNVIQYALVFVMATVALFVYSPFIGGIMFVSLALMYLVPASLGKSIGRRQEAYSTSLALFTMKLKDQFSGYEVIRSYRLVDQVKISFSEQNKSLSKRKYAVDGLLATSEGIASAISIGSQIGTMLIAGFLVLDGQMSAGALLAIMQLTAAFVQPVAVIMQSIPQIQGAQPVFDKLKRLSSPELSSFAGTDDPVFEKNIRFENLSFGYSKEQPVLTGLNLTIEKGKKYVLAGESGCGKSTLIRLLGAEQNGYSGVILVDGKELHDLDIDRLLTKMSTIHQGVYIFDETIKYNIDLGRSYSEEKWSRALSVSGVDKFLDQTEQGLNTAAGEMGSNLSGGQRQRIAVARALIEEKPLLILDEGTNAVDTQTAFDIESALLEIEGLTIITITHNLRPELLRHYDAILFMKQGRIDEAGTFDALVEQKGSFASFRHLEGIIEPAIEQNEVQ